MSVGRVFVLATTNPGKLAEIQQLLEGTGIQVRSQGDFEVGPVAEDAPTFVENALLKARAAAATGHPAIADDSGLEVDVLGGEPGVRSARFAGANADAQANNQLLLERLKGVQGEQRAARFRCVMVLLRHPDDPAPLIYDRVWAGRITEHPRGRGGFGYDPLFVPMGQTLTAAELSASDKNRVSHRGQALRAMISSLTRCDEH